jgi:hypothetical protein
MKADEAIEAASSMILASLGPSFYWDRENSAEISTIHLARPSAVEASQVTAEPGKPAPDRNGSDISFSRTSLME